MRLTELILQSNVKVREMSDEEIAKLRKTLLEIYSDIMNVCKKENLICFLGGGSCLGAIRHKGFIPWDDDLDLNMFREDYDKLPDLLYKYFPGKYSVVAPGFSEEVPYNFYKIEKNNTVLGTIYDTKDSISKIAIDIFPIESVPKNKFHRTLHGLRLNFLFYVGLCVKFYSRNTFADEILSSTKEGKKKISRRKKIGRLFSYKSYSQWICKGDSIAKRKYNSSFVTVPSGRKHYFGEMKSKDTFIPAKKVSFEGLDAYVPNDYDLYLSSLYGDYMVIPPLEKQEKHFIMDIKFGDE